MTNKNKTAIQTKTRELDQILKKTKQQTKDGSAVVIKSKTELKKYFEKLIYK